MLKPYFQSKRGDFTLYKGDSRTLLSQMPMRPVNMVFADPPYFLSNGGFSVQAGKCVSVNKGEWDKSHGLASDTEFNFEWIKACRERMSESATIWICGTFHNIFSVATVLSELDFRILNAVTWQKTNPPPNLSCRFFTHSTEIIVWARKQKKVPHVFNYDLMHSLAGDRQMTDIWRMPAISPWEKTSGKHPAQKPLALVVRAILASSVEGNLILDPFGGTMTTAAVAKKTGRNYTMIERDEKYIRYGQKRLDLVTPQIGDVENAVFDIKPIHVTFKTLVDEGYFKIGEEFIHKNGQKAILADDSGKLNYKDKVDSMHQIAANMMNKDRRVNAFDYLFVNRNGKLVSISDVRDQYRQSISDTCFPL